MIKDVGRGGCYALIFRWQIESGSSIIKVINEELVKINKT